MVKVLFVVLSLMAVTYVSGQLQQPSRCGPNEVVGACGKACDGTCRNPNLDKCKEISCISSGCQCRKGYVRNEANNKCVLPRRCPKFTTPPPPQKCRPGEVWGACGRTCEGTCMKPREPEICRRIRCSYWACRCDFQRGFVRHERSLRCVQKRMCIRRS